MNYSSEFYNRKKFMISIVALFLISCATQNETKMNQYTVGPYDMKIGFGSCLKQNKAMPIFEAIKADSFDLFLMIRRPPRSTHCISSAASDVYKRQIHIKMS